MYQDSLESAQAKLDTYIAAVLQNVAGVNERLFGFPPFRQWYFAVMEAKYCKDVTNNIDRMNTLLQWTYANLPKTPPSFSNQTQQGG